MRLRKTDSTGQSFDVSLKHRFAARAEVQLSDPKSKNSLGQVKPRPDTHILDLLHKILSILERAPFADLTNLPNIVSNMEYTWSFDPSDPKSHRKGRRRSPDTNKRIRLAGICLALRMREHAMATHLFPRKSLPDAQERTRGLFKDYRQEIEAEAEKQRKKLPTS